MNRRKSKSKIFILIILLTILAGGLAYFSISNGENKKEEMVVDADTDSGSKESNNKLSEDEENEIISILNATPYISNVPSSLTYGQIISNAFLEYTLEFNKKDESKYTVSVEGLFMSNPGVKQDYLEIKSLQDEKTAKKLYGNWVYNTTLVFEVDLKNETVEHLYGTESSTLKAYALRSF